MCGSDHVLLNFSYAQSLLFHLNIFVIVCQALSVDQLLLCKMTGSYVQPLE